MMPPGDPGHSPLKAKTKPRVREAPIASKIEIPCIGLLRKTLFTDSGHQTVKVVFPLAPANDLSIPLWSK